MPLTPITKLAQLISRQIAAVLLITALTALYSPLSFAEDTDSTSETETSTSIECPKCECKPCKNTDREEQKPATPIDAATPKHFTGSVQLGALISTGDTEEFTENGAFDFKLVQKKMTYTGLLSALYSYSRTEDDRNERYQAQGQAQYAFTEKNYTFVNTNFIADTDDGYDYIWATQVGYGRRLLNSEKYRMTIDGQAGPGYRIAPTDDSEVKDEQETLNASLIYAWQITESTSLGENISTSYAESDTITTAKTTLSTKLYKGLGLQFASTITHHTNPASASHKTNTYSTVNLVYGF